MRFAALGLLGLLACSGAIAGDGVDKLVISIDLSEWTPSQTLELDLTSGYYVVSPPESGWPQSRPKPQRFEGHLRGDALTRVRQLTDGAFTSGVNNDACLYKAGSKYPPPFSNAVGPEEFTLIKGGVSIKSGEIYCLTKEADEMYDAVTRLFDHRRP